MPGARVHDAITVATGLALAPASYLGLVGLGTPSSSAVLDTLLLVGAHLISGIMFSPDLDLDSAIDDRWGIFFWIWRPYMWLVPHRHRWLSHGLVVSALVRLFYFYVVVMLLFVSFAWTIARIGVVVPDYHIRVSNQLLGLARTHPHEVLAFIAGFITGGAAHTIADWLVTGGKRYLHRMGFRISRDYSDHDHRRHGDRARHRRARSWR
jgi:uncharacterized metal-binding protein